jgi:hypothetical protein
MVGKEAGPWVYVIGEKATEPNGTNGQDLIGYVNDV